MKLNNCYNHPILIKPKISKQGLKEFLMICTTQAPVRHIYGNLC